jgi:hypothetical protein
MSQKNRTDKSVTRKVTKPLPCHLTDEEVLKYGREVARATTERDRIASEAKSVAKDYASKVAEQNAIVGKLSPRIHSGIETRDVQCVQETNWTKLTVKITREDTGEIVECRPMREEEKQMELNPGEKQDAAEDKDNE